MIILLTILGIALLIFAHEFGHFICAKAFGVRVDEFGIGFPPRLFSVTRGETRYSVNLFPLGGFVRLHGETARESEALSDPRSFIAQPAWKRLVVIAAGVAMNVVLGWFVVSTVLFIGTPRGLLIDRVLPDSAATEAGLFAGDFITGFTEGSAFTGYIRAHVGEAITINVVREGKRVAISAIPRAANAGGGILGVVVAEAGAAPLPLFVALREGFVQSAIMMASVVVGLWSILVSLFTQGKLLEGFVGPVGIFSVAQQTGSLGLAFLLQLIGAISLNLAVLNIMPFPALDGGRLLFLVFEKIKGSRLSPRFEMVANATGFALLLMLILAVTLRDVAQLFRPLA
ncbi:MAG: site-2 protease family protein [Candidatus Harrisonbacteria bacterium]|nr:site-2 protease family protein [Candidatus Harrisonbacteria bacterium]